MKRAFFLLLLLPNLAWAQTSPMATPASGVSGSSCPYPEAARVAHNEGTTWLSYRRTREGTIEDVQVLRSSGHADLDEAAVQCMSQSRSNSGDAAARHEVGVHATSITWLLPEPIPGKGPVGIPTGVPHDCFQFYPEAEQKAGIDGESRLRFTVTESGDVRDPVVVQSSGNANLDGAALRCVTTWTYHPGVKDGKPIAESREAEVIWNAPKPTSASSVDDQESRIICKEAPVTGSLFSTRVCRTKAQWDEIARQTQEDLHRAHTGVNRAGK